MCLISNSSETCNLFSECVAPFCMPLKVERLEIFGYNTYQSNVIASKACQNFAHDNINFCTVGFASLEDLFNFAWEAKRSLVSIENFLFIQSFTHIIQVVSLFSKDYFQTELALGAFIVLRCCPHFATVLFILHLPDLCIALSSPNQPLQSWTFSMPTL